MAAVTEAIILAGGLGTRLRSAVPDLPKCMAPVRGKAFVAYVTEYLQQQGINHFIFALGYKSETFTRFMTEEIKDARVSFTVEPEPLGTGGAIHLACSRATTKDILVTNGDTIFKASIGEVAALHEKRNADCTLALKGMEKFDRYGAVELDEENRITAFKEKQYLEKGLINGGVYILNIPNFLQNKFPDKFSFEKEYLENYYTQKPFYGLQQNGYFIDIGIPEDYSRAQTEL